MSSLPAFAKHAATIGASRGSTWQSIDSHWLTSQNTQSLFRVCELLTGAMFSGGCCTCAHYLLLLMSLCLRTRWKIWDSGVQVEFCNSRSSCLHLYVQPRQNTVMFGPDKINLQLWVLICMPSRRVKASYCLRKCKCLVLHDKCCKPEIEVLATHEVPLRKNKMF